MKNRNKFEKIEDNSFFGTVGSRSQKISQYLFNYCYHVLIILISLSITCMRLSYFITFFIQACNLMPIVFNQFKLCDKLLIIVVIFLIYFPGDFYSLENFIE